MMYLSTKVGLFEFGSKDNSGVKYKDNRLLSAKDCRCAKYNVANGTEVICDQAFLNNKNLGNVSLPESVRFIGVSAFEGCTELTSINIPEGVEELKAKTFLHCDSLKCLELPSTLELVDTCALPSSLTTLACNSPILNISGMTLHNCRNLKMVMVPKGCAEFYYHLLQSHNIDAEVEEMTT